APGSVVVFTYVHRRVLTEPAAFDGGPALVARVARLGEPWTFGFEPAELGPYLAARRLDLVEDLGAADYRRRYWGARTDGLRGYEFYRVAVARVTDGPSRG